MSSPRIPLIYGAAGIGTPESNVKVTNPAVAQEIIDVYVKLGGKAIDTSRRYAQGTSEEVLGRTNIHGIHIDTKVPPAAPGDHSAARIKEIFKQSLSALGSHKIRVLYLHFPDRSVPYAETAKAIDELYKEGHFQEFGLSNFYSFEVAEIVTICRANGYIPPTVYEGIYNFLDRTIEAELIPCLRKFGIKFVAYSALASGFLTGVHLDEDYIVEDRSHFDPKAAFGNHFANKYFTMKPELRKVKSVTDKFNLTLIEVAYRWLQHHSAITPEDLGVIIGGRASQIETAFADSVKGPLPEEVVAALEEAWKDARAKVALYPMLIQ